MKQLTLEDYAIIQPYLDKANYEGYNWRCVMGIVYRLQL